MKAHLSSDENYIKFVNTNMAYREFKAKCIPLCAAENVMSPFAKLALLSPAQEKYIMGSVINANADDNFIGCEYIYPYYQIINSQCEQLFHSKYADARTLTGMNAITVLLMSLLSIGDTIAISPPDCGGHASIPDICHRLGLKTVNLPYDYECFDFDYSGINKLINDSDIKAILICISDVINNPKLEEIDQTKNIPIIFDATQTLGLIACGIVNNPFSCFPDNYPFILLGATHKTIPGPSCALILMRNIDLAKQIDPKINPMYLRNTQMHHKMSLILTLLELQYFGKEYGEAIVNNARRLAGMLYNNGLYVLNKDYSFTSTHQVHITCTKQEMYDFYENCIYYNITLNTKTKRLFGRSGIRIGVQEITRYSWAETDLVLLSELLTLLFNNPKVYMQTNKQSRIEEILSILCPKKSIHYTFRKNDAFKMLEKLLTD